MFTIINGTKYNVTIDNENTCLVSLERHSVIILSWLTVPNAIYLKLIYTVREYAKTVFGVDHPFAPDAITPQIQIYPPSKGRISILISFDVFDYKKSELTIPIYASQSELEHVYNLYYNQVIKHNRIMKNKRRRTTLINLSIIAVFIVPLICILKLLVKMGVIPEEWVDPLLSLIEVLLSVTDLTT